MTSSLVFHSGGVELKSEPLGEQETREYRDIIEISVIRIELGECPLADDQSAILGPAEVEQ